ncbi:hypothetical protein EJB05_42609, partial [Eragrostis curvula]
MADAPGTADAGTVRLEEVLVEVFSRMRDVKDIFRCAATCRRWLRLFTDPDFLRRIWPETDCARLRGLFLKGPDRGNMRRICFVPRPESSPLGLEDCSRITSFALNNNQEDESGLLASSRGIILRHIFTYCCCFRSHTDIFLSNPITGAVDKFAAPTGCRCLNVSVAGHAILTAADDGDFSRERRRPSTRRHSTFSQLLLIGHHQDDQRLHQHLHAYSGVTGRWSASVAIRHRSRLRMAGARAGVVHQSAAHWLYRDETIDAALPQDKRGLYMLVATAATERVSLTKLPIQTAGGQPYVCVARDGRLSVACVHHMRVDVWTQQDDEDAGSSNLAAWLLAQMFGKKNWLLSQVIQMPSTAPANENFMSCKWFYFNKGAMMAVYGGNGVFVLDLDTKAMEKIMDLSDCAPSYGYYMCVPYEMDLPEFFLAQLGGLAAIHREREVGWRWPW